MTKNYSSFVRTIFLFHVYCFSEYWYGSLRHSYLIAKSSATCKTTGDWGAVDALLLWNRTEEESIYCGLSTTCRNAVEIAIEISHGYFEARLVQEAHSNFFWSMAKTFSRKQCACNHLFLDKLIWWVEYFNHRNGVFR